MDSEEELEGGIGVCRAGEVIDVPISTLVLSCSRIKLCVRVEEVEVTFSCSSFSRPMLPVSSVGG
jgi:hypothetical protein